MKNRLAITGLLLALSSAAVTQADIFEWEFINPGDPGLGKQQSSTLVPDGAGVDAVPAVNLYNLNLTMAHLIGTDLTNASFGLATLTNADLGQANLTNASFSSATLTNADLGQANLTNASFRFATLTNADLIQANLTNTDFTKATLTSADLTGTEVRGTNFDGATSKGFTASQLYSTASYQAQDLTNIGLRDNDLSGWDFAGQNLTNANFGLAMLTNADLTGADLRGANRASLTEAVVTNLIESNGSIASLHLSVGQMLLVRDYDGNPDADPAPTGPIPITVEKHFIMDAGGILQLRFEADPWDSMISFEPGIPVSLEGTLSLGFASGVELASQVGRTLNLFDWTGVVPTGVFTVASPYTWDLSDLYSTGEVTLVAVPEPSSIAISLLAFVGFLFTASRRLPLPI